MFIASFSGRLTKDADYRVTDQGRFHCDFTVAVDMWFPGEQEPAVIYVRCTFWGEKDKLAPHLTRGRQVFVVGSCRLSLGQDKGKLYQNVDCNVQQVDLGALPQPKEEK